MFETWQQDGALDEQWPLRLPPNRMRNQALEPLQLDRMMRVLDIASQEADWSVREAALALSTEMNKIRTALREQSRRCDLDTYWSYLVTLKRLTRYFDNGDCVFESYFPGCHVNHSTNFLYEYMQVALLTASRLCEQACAKEVPTARCAEDLRLARYLFEDLRRCAEYCLSDKLMQSGKYYYYPEPSSFGSNQSTQQQHRQRVVQAMKQEREQLHRFVQHDLHGLDGLAIRATLCGIKMVECCVYILAEKVASLDDIGERCEKTYVRLAPLMLSIRRQYDEVTALLIQQHPRSTLFRYAQAQSYLWYLKAEFAMVQVEWASFSTDAVIDIELYGKRAVKRLRTLAQSVNDKERWLLSLNLGNALKKRWEVMKKAICQLYEDVRGQMVEPLWNSAMSCAIPEIQPHRQEDDQRSITDVFGEHWDQMMKSGRYEALGAVLGFMEDGSIVESASVYNNNNNNQYDSNMNDNPHDTNNNTSIVDTIFAQHGINNQSAQYGGGDAIREKNQYTMGVAHDRKLHLEWLVSMIGPDGTITIGQDGCDWLRQQLYDLNQFIESKGITPLIQ